MKWQMANGKLHLVGETRMKMKAKAKSLWKIETKLKCNTICAMQIARKFMTYICSSTCFVQQSLQKDSRSSCCKVHWAQAVAFCPSVAPGQPVSKLLRSHRSRDERNEELSLQRVQRVCVICVIMCLSIAILLSLDSMLSLASWFGLSHPVSFYTAFADVQSP